MKKIVDVFLDGSVIASIPTELTKAKGRSAPDEEYIKEAKRLHALNDPNTEFVVRDP